jgi:hypothetical protein
MLTMDQILASNELTMAATAAMPAMVRHIPCWFKLSSVFSPSSFFCLPFLFLFSFLFAFFLLLCLLSTLLASCILINPIFYNISLVHAAHCSVIIFIFLPVSLLLICVIALMQSMTVLLGIGYSIKNSQKLANTNEEVKYEII